MTADTSKPAPIKPKSPGHQDRLAERLRENLKKRKEQARAREAKDEGQDGAA